MTADPELLLSAARGVSWPESRATLRRVTGPMLSVPPGESLTWFDPLDGAPQLTSLVEPGALPRLRHGGRVARGLPGGAVRSGSVCG